MPRRKGSEADSAASKARETRWRYLLRNPDFCAEINGLLDTYDLIGAEIRRHRRAPTRNATPAVTTAPRKAGELQRQLGRPALSDASRRRAELQAKASRLEEKLTALTTSLGFVLPIWELRRGRTLDWSVNGMTLPKLAVDTVAQYEKLIGDGACPVSIIEDHDGETSLGPAELASPYTMYLAVDLVYPKDVLLALMERALSQVIEERKAILTRDPRKRQRIDKADFEIVVYDEVIKGEPFPAIANRLGRPVSSVKSAYLAACKNIFGSAPPRRKRHMPLVGFSPNDHVRSCNVCSSAQRPEDMCSPARAYGNQDYVSLKERPVGEEPRRRRGNRA
jgi:hypothetical protein